MNKKKICVIANGYAEEMMAAKLMSALRIELQQLGKDEDYQFVGGSLVSSGKWFQEERFATFFSGGMTPSGGFPTRSWEGFFSDLGAGAFLTPFKFKDMIKNWAKYNLDVIIVVGDFLLMMLAVPALKNHDIPMIFIPTAKSDYIQAHFKIEKKFIKKHAAMSFPRDQITSNDFSEFKIPSLYYGNLMQDLLDLNAPTIESQAPIVALLPGSREESYENLEMIIQLLPEVNNTIHWALVQAGNLDNDRIKNCFINQQWAPLSSDNNIPVWSKGKHKVYCYPNTMFDSVALSCDFGISLAGTASEQLAGLGKPIVAFKGTGPQSTSRRMEDNAKLLGDAFIYEKSYPKGVIHQIEELINNEPFRKQKGQEGFVHMGKPGATKKIAEYIINNILEK